MPRRLMALALVMMLRTTHV